MTPPKPVPRRRRTARLVATVALAVGMVSLAVVLLRQNATRTQPGAVPATVVAGPTVEVTATATEASSGTTPGFGVSTGADPGVGASGGMAGAVPTEQRQTAPGVVVPAAVLARLDRGVCLTWTAVSGATATGVNVVDCSGPHRAEVTGLVDLAERFPAWPGRGALDGVVEQSCPEALADHMVADPRGLLAQPSGAYPAQAEWTGGSRALACLVVDQVSGTWSGSVRESDQVA